jgi:hypothetical protein
MNLNVKVFRIYMSKPYLIFLLTYKKMALVEKKYTFDINNPYAHVESIGNLKPSD